MYCVLLNHNIKMLIEKDGNPFAEEIFIHGGGTENEFVTNSQSENNLNF